MKTSEIIRAWRKILRGEQPSLSIEITRECPLRCPGCYAYEDAHLGRRLPFFSRVKASPMCSLMSGVSSSVVWFLFTCAHAVRVRNAPPIQTHSTTQVACVEQVVLLVLFIPSFHCHSLARTCGCSPCAGAMLA